MSDVLIIDYGFCNLDSVFRAVQECGGKPKVSNDPAEASKASKLILPGVGSFYEGIKAIRSMGWDEAILNEVNQGIPILGICLGMQLMATKGYEGGEAEGLGLIPGQVRRFQTEDSSLSIPHVGWNEVQPVKPSAIFEGIPSGKDFYFVHSYHFSPDNSDKCLASTPYGGDFASVIGREHIVGTQFHPEKSLRTGIQLIRNFVTIF